MPEGVVDGLEAEDVLDEASLAMSELAPRVRFRGCGLVGRDGSKGRSAGRGLMLARGCAPAGDFVDGEEAVEEEDDVGWEVEEEI